MAILIRDLLAIFIHEILFHPFYGIYNMLELIFVTAWQEISPLWGSRE